MGALQKFFLQRGLSHAHQMNTVHILHAILIFATTLPLLAPGTIFAAAVNTGLGAVCYIVVAAYARRPWGG